MSKALSFYEKERLKFNSDKTSVWTLTFNKNHLFELLSLNEIRCVRTNIVILEPSEQFSGFSIHKRLEQQIWEREAAHVYNF